MTDERLKEGISLNTLFGADRKTLTDAWWSLGENMRGQPRLLVELQHQLQQKLFEIWFSDSDVPVPDDPRFADPEWRENAFFKRLAQAYSAWSEVLDTWLESSDLPGIERQRAAFLIDAAKDAFAPVNSPITPEAIRAASPARPWPRWAASIA